MVAKEDSPQRDTGVYDATRISVGQEKDPKNKEIGRWLIDAGQEGSGSYGEDKGGRGDEVGKIKNKNVKMPQIRDEKDGAECQNKEAESAAKQGGALTTTNACHSVYPLTLRPYNAGSERYTGLSPAQAEIHKDDTIR